VCYAPNTCISSIYKEAVGGVAHGRDTHSRNPEAIICWLFVSLEPETEGPTDRNCTELCLRFTVLFMTRCR
jgi:hypothetical protein